MVINRISEDGETIVQPPRASVTGRGTGFGSVGHQADVALRQAGKSPPFWQMVSSRWQGRPVAPIAISAGAGHEIVARKTRVLVHSSVVGAAVAKAIQQNLQYEVSCDVRPQGLFGLGEATMDTILAAVTSHDFGIFVLSPEDVQVMRNDGSAASRDNVLLEAALFIGRYARDRVLVVKPIGVHDVGIPTDLLGVTVTAYDPTHFALNPLAALGPAANQILAAIQTSSSYNRHLTVNVSFSRGGRDCPLKLWLLLRNQTDVDVVVTADHFRCHESLRPALQAVRHEGTCEYEIKFPDRQNHLSLSACLLVRGDSVSTWFPLDETHTDAEAQLAVANAQAGEFHFTCHWLGATPMVRRYARRV